MESEHGLTERVTETTPRDWRQLALVGLGVFVALVGLTTVLTRPWRYLGGLDLAVVRGLGALLAVALGAGLTWLALRD